MKKQIPVRKQNEKRAKIAHPGMMGDGTEEQSLGQRGDPVPHSIHCPEFGGRFGATAPETGA